MHLPTLLEPLSFEIGTMTRPQLREALGKAGVQLNDWATVLLDDPIFDSPERETITVVEHSLIELGLEDGAVLSRIFQTAREGGLHLCPSGAAPYLRRATVAAGLPLRRRVRMGSTRQVRVHVDPFIDSGHVDANSVVIIRSCLSARTGHGTLWHDNLPAIRKCRRLDSKRKPLPASGAEMPLSPSGEIEIGWHLHPDAWGHGYASEAARAVLAHAFVMGLDRISAVTNKDNVASQAVAQRIGMTHKGTTSDYYNAECELFSVERK